MKGINEINMNYNKNNFFIKLTHNHVISLITLVITIVVVNGNGTGFRPIICLKSSTKLKEIKEGKNYEI